MSDQPEPTIEHAPLCRRPKPPIVRMSWREMVEELYFPCCGRYGPVGQLDQHAPGPTSEPRTEPKESNQ